MTWNPERQAFVCGRGAQRCRGTGAAAVLVSADEDYDQHSVCPVCGRVDLPTYTTDATVASCYCRTE